MLRIHMQTAQIKDDEARFIIRPEAEEQPALNRAVYDAIARMSTIFGTYMEPVTASTESSALALPQSFAFELSLNPRRLASNEQSLANAMFTYIVDSAIYSFYLANSASELVKIQLSAIETDTQNLEQLIFIKREPTYSQPNS